MGRSDDGRGPGQEPPPRDVVLFGEEPDTGGGRRRQRWWLVAALVVGVVVGLSVYADHRAHKSASPTPSHTPVGAAPLPVTSTSPQPRTPSPTVRAVGRPILGITAGWELFASGSDGIERIEFAAGKVVHTPMPPLQSTGPAWLLVGDDWALLEPLDRVTGYLVHDDQPARALGGVLSQGGIALPGPGGEVWMSPAAVPTTMSLVDVEGRQTGPSMTVPRGTGTVVADGTGNVVAIGDTGAYLVRPTATRQITHGSIIAVGPSRFLVRDCEKVATCPPIVIDRATGARHGIKDSPVLVGGGTVGAISPDGKVAAVVGGGPETGDPATRVHLVDLATGTDRELDVPLGDFTDPGMIVWSPDSRWLFIVGNLGVLYAVDATSGHTTDFGVLVPPVSLLAIRNATGA